MNLDILIIFNYNGYLFIYLFLLTSEILVENYGGTEDE